MKVQIWKKLLLSYCALVVITLMLVGAFLTPLFRSYLVTAQKTELMQQAEEIVNLTEKYYVGEIDESTFNRILDNVNRINKSRVVILDREGKVIAPNMVRPRPERRGEFRTRGFPRGTRLSREEVGQVLSGQIVAKEGTMAHLNIPVISVAIPVLMEIPEEKAGEQVVGAVLSFSPVYLVTDLVKKVGYFLGISSIMAIFLAIVIAYFFAKKISSPVKEINEVALAMAQGDYKKVISPTGNDELGELANSMNYLAQQLDVNVSALQQEKGKLEAIMASINEGLVAVDRAGRIMLVNPMMEIFFMTTAQNLMSKQLEEISPHPQFSEAFAEALEKEELVVKEFKLVHSTCQITVSPIKQENGEILGAVGILLDISEMEKVEQLRRDFISNVSHELRAPLTVIRGFTECLLDGVTQHPPAYYYGVIKDETLRLERLINDIMELSLLQAGKINLELEEVNLVALVYETANKFMLKAQEKGITLMTNASNDPDRQIMLFCDPDRMEQLLYIFIDNALKYTPAGGTVEVNVWENETNKKVYLIIKDTGIGIPREELPYIWERFYKVDKSRSRQKEDGTGLGLFIAKQLAELHQAEVLVESVVDKGTTFTLVFKRR
ncbi:MAG TPA: ATP-binding protein [Peptococcaceae bacterium]|nr:ATP-binding protein [Peptococcaceae bacterium]HPZ71159.1 ATP-binding protein [Peptococcaceae bacterium]HQD54485.1 ATP-binding protein [Peptococcaceae bacterium]